MRFAYIAWKKKEKKKRKKWKLSYVAKLARKKLNIPKNIAIYIQNLIQCFMCTLFSQTVLCTKLFYQQSTDWISLEECWCMHVCVCVCSGVCLFSFTNLLYFILQDENNKFAHIFTHKYTVLFRFRHTHRHTHANTARILSMKWICIKIWVIYFFGVTIKIKSQNKQ